MAFENIYNSPVERRRVTYSYVTWDRAFTEEELKNIDDYCYSSELTTAKTVGEEDEEKIKQIRRSKIKFFHRNNDTAWIFDRFNFVIKQLNDQFYGFDLNGYDSFQYTLYEYEDNGKYDWHMDIIMNEISGEFVGGDTRKLSLVLLLNEPGKDFTGGEFELNLGNESNACVANCEKGRIIAFPSYMIHRVKPVLSGNRKSIVIWVEGPKFR